MAEYNPALSNVEIGDDEELVKKLPSIPSSDEVTAYGSPEHSHERQGSIDERLHRLRSVTQGVIAARKFRRSSSIQGKYVAITPNERDNLEHIQHMTEDITARLDRLRGDSEAPPVVDKEETPQKGELYIPPTVQGKFVEFVPFDASRPSPLRSLSLSSDGSASLPPRFEISPLPPLPPVDPSAFYNGNLDEMEDDADAEEGASVTASLERRLRDLTENRTQ